MKIVKKVKTPEVEEKINLQLDGVTINSLEELQNNPSTELCLAFENGSLVTWLRQNDASHIADKLENLNKTNDLAENLTRICNILEIDIDIDDVRAALQDEVRAEAEKNKKFEYHRLDVTNLKIGKWSIENFLDKLGLPKKSSEVYFNDQPQIYAFDKWYIIYRETLFCSENFSDWKVIQENLPFPSTLRESNERVFLTSKDYCGVVAENKLKRIDLPGFLTGIVFRDIFYNGKMWFIIAGDGKGDNHMVVYYGENLDNLSMYHTNQNFGQYKLKDLTFCQNKLVGLYRTKSYPKKYIVVSSSDLKSWDSFDLSEENGYRKKTKYDTPFVVIQDKLYMDSFYGIYQFFVEDKKIGLSKINIERLEASGFPCKSVWGHFINELIIYKHNEFVLLSELYEEILSFDKNRCYKFALSNNLMNWKVIEAPIPEKINGNQIAYNSKLLVIATDKHFYTLELS